MCRALLLVMALLTVGRVFTQSWCPPQARWMYVPSGPGGPLSLTYAGDTVVDGFVGQRITQAGVMPLPWDPDSMVETSGPDIVTRTESGLVMLWQEAYLEWDTLYWFSAQPGDKWSPGWRYFIGEDECLNGAYVQVVDTGTTLVEGIPLRTLELERYRNDGEVDASFTVLERMGNIDEFLLFYPPNICMVNEALMLFSCYADVDLSYPTPGLACELTTSIVRARDPMPDWSVAPNPFTKDFTVYFARPMAQGEVSLLDPTGRVLENITITGTRVQVDGSALPAGPYLLRLTDGQGRVVHKQVIKQ